MLFYNDILIGSGIQTGGEAKGDTSLGVAILVTMTGVLHLMTKVFSSKYIHLLYRSEHFMKLEIA